MATKFKPDTEIFPLNIRGGKSKTKRDAMGVHGTPFLIVHIEEDGAEYSLTHQPSGVGLIKSNHLGALLTKADAFWGLLSETQKETWRVSVTNSPLEKATPQAAKMALWLTGLAEILS